MQVPPRAWGWVPPSGRLQPERGPLSSVAFITVHTCPEAGAFEMSCEGVALTTWALVFTI